MGRGNAEGDEGHVLHGRGGVNRSGAKLSRTAATRELADEEHVHVEVGRTVLPARVCFEGGSPQDCAAKVGVDDTSKGVFRIAAQSS